MVRDSLRVPKPGPFGSALQQQIDRIDRKKKCWGVRRYTEAEQDAEDLVECYRRIEGLFRRLQVSAL
jgi:hypothetical protein